MANELLKALGIVPKDDEEAVMMQQPAPVTAEPTRAPANPVSPIRQPSRDPAAIAPVDPISGTYEPIQSPRLELKKDYISPKIQLPEAQSNGQLASDLESKLDALRTQRDAEMADAAKRERMQAVFAAIGNYLPKAVAGATAMNTKAAVKAPELPTIGVDDLQGKVQKKYNTDYEGLISQVKALKEGNLTPKDILNARIAQAYIDAGTNRMNNNATATETNANTRIEGMDDRRKDKFQTEASNAMKSLRATDNWKTAEKQLGEISTIKTLIQDAKTKGGNSLAMLGPKVAKGIAGEVGTMTEQDVTRYIKNPTLVGGYIDSYNKLVNGRLSEATAEDLTRLTELAEASARDKMRMAVDREAQLFSRNQGIPLDHARYFLDTSYNNNKNVGYANKEYAINPIEKTVSSKDQAAMQWLEKNPNHPRAAEVRAKLGK